MRWSKRYSILAGSVFVFCVLSVLHPAVQQQAEMPGSSPSALPAPSHSQEAPAKAQPEFFVMIDPSHGGEDRGAVFSSRIVEKDVTLALALELRRELQDRGIPARLLRDSDVSLSLERRAEVCNQQRPGLYIALHAGAPGTGVRIYAPLLTSSEMSVGSFLPWQSAQAPLLGRSEAMAKAVSQALQKKNIKAPYLQVFLRPLNNVIAPAIAVEIAVDRGDLRSLETGTLQDTVASAVASAIAQSRARAGGRK